MRLLAASLAVALVAVSSSALAAPTPKERAEARTQLNVARKAAREKRWPEAILAFRKADKLDPTPALELELGQALAAGGKLVEARHMLAQIAESTDTHLQRRTRDAAKKALSDVKARVPTVKVVVSGGPAGKPTLLVDGVEVESADELSLNPGDHTIGVAAPGYDGTERDVHCAEGVHSEVALSLTVKEPPKVVEKKSPSRVPGAVVTALGGAGLVVGGVFGGLAFMATSSAKSHCQNNVCPPSANDDISRSKLYGNVSTAAFIAGGAVTLTGIVLLIVPPGSEKSDEKSARLTPWIGPGLAGAGVSGSF